MNKALITAVMGLGMLYAQSVCAADASNTESAAPKTHKAQKSHHHAKKHHHGKHHQAHSGSKAHHHHHKHHRHHHHKHPQRGYPCPRDCDEGMLDQRAYLRNQAMNGSGLDQIENNMNIINRDHDPARGGREARGR